MPRGTYANLTGLAKVRNKLGRVYTIASDDVSVTLPIIAKIVADDAAAHLTPGHGYDTGKLAESITVGPVERVRRIIFVKVGPSKDAWYGRFIEFGTRLIAAMPFLRPARDKNVGPFKSRLRASQREALKRV